MNHQTPPASPERTRLWSSGAPGAGVWSLLNRAPVAPAGHNPDFSVASVIGDSLTDRVPPPPASQSNKAVFLSYASEDAEAARRICDALRAGGVEVWLDQSELRGGEAWDRSIRRQIKECALFVPIISIQTQERPEGYFRLEWHLAEQRSLLIAKGRPFIVPVIIDAIAEQDAIVPDAFLAVQWSRLPAGQVPPTFAEQLKRLLSGEIGRDRLIQASVASTSSASPLQPKDSPPQIPDFDLLRLIGQGSYGDVWLARSVTGIYRAIKVVWRARFKDAGPYEREFRGLKEFAAMSLGESIQMALLHVGRNDTAGFFYYVMELADDVDRGRDIDPARYAPLTLTEVRARNGRIRVPAKDCLGYGVELARVLAGLHRRGLVHRDIKPSNVILVGGVPKLADIGLVTQADATMTYVGTEGFVPPEGPGSASADVFALGRLLYELATGLDRTEFPQLPPDLKKLTDHRLLLELNEIILKACDPVAANRYRDGTSLLADLSALQAGSSVRRRRIGAGLLRVALTIAAVLAVAAVAYWQWPRAGIAEKQRTEDGRQRTALSPEPKSQTPDPNSVAVLAFANHSGEPGNEYFSDGISEELLTVMQKIPGLRVTARASAFSFKGTKATATEIGQKLGVTHLVEGSVRRMGNQVRITVNLSRAATGEQVWSEGYTRKLEDIFAVQSEIAEAVVAQVRRQITGEAPDVAGLASIRGQVRTATKGGTTNVAAYDQYLQGRFQVNLTTMEDFARAEGYFRRATELDPTFALGFVGLAMAHLRQGMYTVVPGELTHHFAQAGQALDRALALEPNLAEGLGAKAELLIWSKYDWRGADQALRQALALAPRDPAILGTAASLAMITGQIDRSIALGRQATEIDPLNVLTLMNLSSGYAIQRRYPEAAALKRRALELNPQAMQVHGALADDYVMQGRFDEAVEELKKEPPGWYRDLILANALWGQGKVSESEEALNRLKALGDIVGSVVGYAYAYRQDADQAFAWLERGLQGGDVGVLNSKTAPWTTSLHADPRWPAWLRKLGLHDDQLAEFIPDYQETKFTPPTVLPPRGNAPVKANPTPPVKQKTSVSAKASEGREDGTRKTDGGGQRTDASTTLSNPTGTTPVGLSNPGSPVATAAAQPHGIAVLPFENLAGADQAYFAGGITEEVTQHLSKIKVLRVMSPAAVARFRGGAADLPAMARELSIGAILTGSVRRAGDQVRIAVQLLSAPGGETLWSEQYDREPKDIFSVQTDVAVRVARALQASLAPEDRARIERLPTANAAALDLYLQAGRKPHPAAIELLKQAIALDPKFALAYAAMARRYIYMSASTGRDDLNRALEASRTALTLDPQLARAYFTQANSLAGLGQIDAARLSMLRAIELDPSFAAAFNDMAAMEGNAGRHDQAVYWAVRGFPLAPNIAFTWYHVAGPLVMLDEAVGERWLRAGIARFPADDKTGVYRLHLLMVYLELVQGQQAAAMERLRKEAAARPTNLEVSSMLTELAVFTDAADARERIDQVMQQGPGARLGNLAYTARTLRAYLWIKAGDRASALPLIDTALAENRAAFEGGDRSSWTLHENAALQLLRGDRAAALDALEAAANAGFKEGRLLKVDPLLAPLATEPRFLKVVERIERDLREMRDRSNLGEIDDLLARYGK